MLQSEKPSYKSLKSLGFSPVAISCYESLFEHGGTNVPDLAKRLKHPRTGLYRILKQLEAKGFLTKLKTDLQPTYYFAIDIEEALSNYDDYQRHVLHKLISHQRQELRRRSG
jgi:sugar-specific transcriptional regulator TrmB